MLASLYPALRCPSQVDGYGNALFMDDANIPSLLALPWLGYTKVNKVLFMLLTNSNVIFVDFLVQPGDDLYPVYLRTRKRVLSAANPYFQPHLFAWGSCKL